MGILPLGKILPIDLRIPPSPPRVRCEYSNILMVPTSAPSLHVRGMGIATSLTGGTDER